MMRQSTILSIYNVKKINVIALIFSASIFILCRPYFTWQHTALFNKLIAVVIFFSIIYVRQIKTYDIFIIPLFLLFISYTSFLASRDIFGFISSYGLIFILLIKKEQFLLFFKYFKNIFTIFLFLSLIVYIAIVIFNINISHTLISPLNTGKEWYYYQYPFLVSENPLGLMHLNIRFNGFLDEPGLLGSYIVFFLLADKFDLRSKQNKVLFVAGILTFSLYFYIALVVYFLYNATIRTRFYFLLVAFIIFLVTYNIEIIYSLVWNRLRIEDGRILGDNRSSFILDAVYERLFSSSDLFWGIGPDYASKYVRGYSSYKGTILAYGLVYFIIFVSSFSLYAFYNIKRLKYVLVFLFMFFGMVYQRPSYITNPSLFFLIISSVYTLEYFCKEEEQNFNIKNKKSLSLNNQFN